MCRILLLAYVRNQRIFVGKKRSVGFVTGHLFTFQVVVSLICSVTTQILICENQTIWRLEILKKQERNISQWCTWSWKIRVVNILLLEQPLMPDYAHLAHPPPHKHPHTHQQKGHCLPSNLCPSHLQPTQPFFQFPSWRMHKFCYHTTAQKLKKIYSLKVHINRIQYQQVQEINTTFKP